MKIIANTVLLSLSLLLCSTRADAQCTSGCNLATEQWTNTYGYNSSNSDTIVLGMIRVGNNYYGAACGLVSGSYVMVGGWDSHPYTTTTLDSDTSYCSGGGNDFVWFLNGGQTMTCIDLIYGFPRTLYGFTGALYDFTVSGGAGQDTLIGRASNSILCGGTENDTLLGGAGADYIDGDEHNDWINGSANGDVVRGGSGNDVLVHANYSVWAEYVLGDSGNDCIDFADEMNYINNSSCGDGTDYYEPATQSSGLLAFPPDSCTYQTPDCCALSGRTCP